jgi:hypothetical protein
MRILDLIKVFPDLYEARTAVHLIGPPGCGKSEVLKYEIRDVLSDRYGERFGFCGKTEEAWLLPTLDAPDLRGFLVPTKDPTTGEATSYFTRSPLYPSDDYLEAHPRGIFVLDERNAADLLTQKAAAPVILSKLFGDRRLPEGWMVVSASNRVSDRAGVIRPPTHLTNREVMINLEADAVSWAVWAEKHGLHPMTIAFAKKMPGAVFSESVPAGDGAFATARSFTAAAKFLAIKAGVDKKGNVNMELPNDPLTQQVVAGSVGDGSAAQMFAFFKLHDKLPDIEDIIKDPTKAKCPTQLDAAYAAVQLCIHYAKPENIDRFWTYVERLPRELQVSAAVSLIKRGGGVLINSKALGAWVSKNRALISNVMDN